MVIGEQDAGKTTLCLECGTPVDKIAFFDNDIKTSALVKQIKDQDRSFGYYLNLFDARKGKTELEFHDFCIQEIEKLGDDIETLIWDNFSPFEDTMHPKILEDPNKYRQNWAKKGDIKGAQQWIASFDLLGQIVSDITRKVPLTFVTYHLKNLSKAGVKTDKKIPAAKRTVPKISNMTIWLRMNEQGSGPPIGLILKRPGKIEVNESGALEMVNVLPRKMVPCTWEEIRKFWNDPMGDREPTENEVPNPHELSILDGTLSPDQKKSFELMLKYGRFEEESEILDAAKSAEAIKDYMSENPDAKPAEVKESLGLDIPIPKIIQAMKSGE